MQTQVQASASTITEQTRQKQRQPEYETDSAQLLGTPQFEDGRPEVTAQLHQQSQLASSPRVTQLQATQAMMAASPQVQQLKATQALIAAGTLAKQNHQASVAPITQRMEDEEPLQSMAEEPVQREQTEASATNPTPQDAPPPETPKPNNTGLPDNLKSGIENLSGMSMDHVKVHYNSDKPAQLQAHAYAQASEIHVAPGQEQFLPHEAWHVVQQAQGRVKPTMQMKDDVSVNDDVGLEHEADVMGARAVQLDVVGKIDSNPPIAFAADDEAVGALQRKEFIYVGNKMNSGVEKSNNCSSKSVAQLEQEYVAGEGDGPGKIIEVEDKEDRKGWSFWQLGNDFVWVKAEDQEKFSNENKGAISMMSASDGDEEERVDNAPEEVSGDEGYEVGEVISIDMIKESNSDHKYVIVMVKDGPNIKMHYGSGGGLYKENQDISNHHGVPVHSYKPPSKLTGKKVSEVFWSTKGSIETKFTGGNCGELAGDLIELLGGKMLGSDYDFLK